VLHRLPLTGVLWLAGFFAITGTPPFGVFLSEFAVLRAALEQERGWVAGVYLALLGVIFVGMASAVLPMAQGRGAGPAADGEDGKPGVWQSLPPLVLLALVLALGLSVPPALDAVLHEFAALTGRGSG
jgi:hydrogenase-4 component F